MSKKKANDASPRFKSMPDLAGEFLKGKLPNWKPKTPAEGKNALGWAISYLMDVEFAARYPKLRYDSTEALRRAKAGNDDDLCRLLVCSGLDLLMTPWVVERYLRAHSNRDEEFMRKFWWTVAEHYSVTWGAKKETWPELRPRFLGWLSANREMRNAMTAAEILDAWEAYKRKKGIQEVGFLGPHRVQNFRRWLTQHGWTVGRKGKHRKCERVWRKRTRAKGMSDTEWRRLE